MTKAFHHRRAMFKAPWRRTTALALSPLVTLIDDIPCPFLFPAIIIACHAALPGCSAEDEEPRHIPQSEQVAARAAPRATNKESSASNGENSLLTNDFGILRPGVEQTCVFKVSNSGDYDWTIDHIQRTCSCTAADTLHRVISPGESADITVSYRAPSKAADEERVLTVFFREP